MMYYHFDTDAIRKAVLDSAAANMDLALAQAKTDADRQYILGQREMVPATAEAIVATIRLANAGRSSRFIGAVLGHFTSLVLVNTISNLSDGDELFDAWKRVLKLSLDAASIGGDPNFVSAGDIHVKGEAGGRA